LFIYKRVGFVEHNKKWINIQTQLLLTEAGKLMLDHFFQKQNGGEAPEMWVGVLTLYIIRMFEIYYTGDVSIEDRIIHLGQIWILTPPQTPNKSIGSILIYFVTRYEMNILKYSFHLPSELTNPFFNLKWIYSKLPAGHLHLWYFLKSLRV